MKNSKLLRVMRLLSPEERKRFQVFLESPYCNPHPRICKLYEEILRFSPEFRHKNLNKTFLQKKLYGKKKYREQKIADEISLLYRRLKDFLATEWKKREAHLPEREALLAFSEKGLSDLFEIEFRRLEKALLQRPFLDETYHRQLWALSDIRNDHLRRQNDSRSNEGLVHKHQALDQYYLAIKLRESCEALQRSLSGAEKIELELSDELMNILANKGHPYRKIPVIDVYYHLYLALSQAEQDIHFNNLLEALDLYASFFAPEEARTIYAYVQEYCLRRIEKGEERFEGELFRLYEALIQNGTLLQKDILRHTDYYKILSLGLKLGKLDWTREFLHIYRDKLEPSFQQNAYRFGMAAYLNEKGEGREALVLLQSISFADVFYQLASRMLTMRVYYQLRDFDSLRYQINAFRHFLGRTTGIKKDKRNQYLLFLNWMKKLARLSEQSRLEPVEKWHIRQQTLLEEFQENPSLLEQKWLEKELRRSFPK